MKKFVKPALLFFAIMTTACASSVVKHDFTKRELSGSQKKKLNKMHGSGMPVKVLPFEGKY